MSLFTRLGTSARGKSLQCSLYLSHADWVAPKARIVNLEIMAARQISSDDGEGGRVRSVAHQS